MNVKIFKNESFGEVRVAGTSDEPLFCLADVCRTLALDASDVRKRLRDEVVAIHPIHDSLNREQKANFVNEDGLYDVILDSRKEEAKKFRKWITSEVIPSIRKTGGYVNDSTFFVETYFADLDESAKSILIQTLDSKKQLLEDNKRKQARIEEMKPKEDFYDTVIGSNDTIDMRQVALTLNIGLGRNRIFEILRELNILDRRNQPYQTYVDRGYFRTVESSYMKGDMVCINIKTVVFQKGVDFIKKSILDYLSKQKSS